MDERTHFGYEDVTPEEKTRRVRGVFDSVAGKYDVMNDLMSGGLHRLWKRFAVDLVPLRPGQRCWISPAAPATSRASSPARWARRASSCTPTSTTRCSPKAATSCIDAGSRCRRRSAMPRRCRSPSRTFDLVSIAFGLRNVTRKEVALAEMRRVLRPGGAALVLEFSRVAQPLAPAYDWYSFNVLPRSARSSRNDEASYRYLAESIRVHPDQEALAPMMEQAGFDKVEYHNLTAGVVAVHVGRVY